MCSSSSRSIETSNTNVLQILSLNTNIKYSCDPQLLTQHKHQILMCLRAHAQHKYLINYVLQGPCPTHGIIYIKHMHLDYTQCTKQIIILMCSGVLCPIYKIKHQNNIICNGAYDHKCEVKNLGYYSCTTKLNVFGFNHFTPHPFPKKTSPQYFKKKVIDISFLQSPFYFIYKKKIYSLFLFTLLLYFSLPFTKHQFVLVIFPFSLLF